MRRRWQILGLAAAAMSAQAAAEQPGRGAAAQQDRGDGWNIRQNRHGAVVSRGGIMFYLGRDCDALSPRYGRGRWGWANGGWLVVFPRRRFGFPRQDPPIADARCDVPS